MSRPSRPQQFSVVLAVDEERRDTKVQVICTLKLYKVNPTNDVTAAQLCDVEIICLMLSRPEGWSSPSPSLWVRGVRGQRSEHVPENQRLAGDEGQVSISVSYCQSNRNPVIGGSVLTSSQPIMTPLPPFDKEWCDAREQEVGMTNYTREAEDGSYPGEGVTGAQSKLIDTRGCQSDVWSLYCA